MAILSKIKSKLKSTATKVKNTVTGVVSKAKNAVGDALTGANQVASPSSALNFDNKLNNQLQEQRKGLPGYGTPAYNNTNEKYLRAVGANNPGSIQTGGSIGSASSVSSPVSYKSGSKPSMGASGSWSTSDYTSPSYSPDSSALATDTFTASSTPGNMTISSGTIGSGTSSMVMPSAPTGNNYNSEVIGNNIKVGANPGNGLIEREGVIKDTDGNVVPAKEEKMSDARTALDDMLDSLREPPSEAKLYEKAIEESGLKEALARRNSSQNALNAITTRMNQDILQLRTTAAKEGVTEAVYGGQVSQITRDANIQSLPIQAQLAADQGDVELAQENTNTLFKLYANDAKASVDFYNKQVEKVYDLFKEEEKKVLDEKREQKSLYADLVRNASKEHEGYAQEALAYARATGKWAPYRAITGVRPPVNVNSPSFNEDYQNYLTDLSEALGKFDSVVSPSQTVGSGGASGGPMGSGSTQGEYGSPEYVVSRLQQTAASKTKPVASEREQLGKFGNVIAQTSNLINTLDNTKTDPIIGYLKSLNPYNFDARAVNAQVNALVPNVARGVYGEVGVLTDQDISRYLQTLPNIKSTKEQNKFVALMTLSNAMRSYEQTLLNMANSGVNVSGFVDSYKNVVDKVDVLEAELGGGGSSEVTNDAEQIYTESVGAAESSSWIVNLWRNIFD